MQIEIAPVPTQPRVISQDLAELVDYLTPAIDDVLGGSSAGQAVALRGVEEDTARTLLGQLRRYETRVTWRTRGADGALYIWPVAKHAARRARVETADVVD